MTKTKTKNENRTAMETALESCRRSRNNAKKLGDHQIAAVMLQCESKLLQLEADRMNQTALRGILEAEAQKA